MKTNFKKYFYLDGKRIVLLLVLELVFIILHNLVSAILGVEDALFFILAIFILPLFFLISVIYTLVYLLKKKKT